MKHLFFLFLLCLGFALTGRAQQAPRQASYDRTMQQSSLIFEGRVVSTTAYLNADTTRWYQSSIVEITNVLRGELRPGTVQVVYKGFKIAGYTEVLVTLAKTLVLLAQALLLLCSQMH